MTGSAGSLSGGEARATWGGPHLQERLAAGGQNTEGNGGASSEPESAGGARGGCGGTELAAGSSVNTGSPGSRARRQTLEGLNGVKPGSAAEIEDTRGVGAPECGSGPQEGTFPRDSALEAAAKRP